MKWYHWLIIIVVFLAGCAGLFWWWYTTPLGPHLEYGKKAALSVDYMAYWYWIAGAFGALGLYIAIILTLIWRSLTTRG